PVKFSAHQPARSKERAGFVLSLVHDPLQIVERKNPGGMAVAPDRLDGITSDTDQLFQLKRRRRERHDWSLIDVPHTVSFSFATGTGTGPAQFLQWDEILAPVIPLNGQFRAN